MWKFCGVLLIPLAAWNLAACHTAPRKASTPIPEAEQAIGESLKALYMSASAAVPQSPEQQKVILRMAEKASNGKELLLVMRAAVGVFATNAGAPENPVEKRLRSIVAGKMMQVAALDQLIEYSMQYSVEPESARRFVQRMFQLGEGNSNPRVWYRIRVAALHLKLNDLERQAQARGDELAGR
jgi:hypothetical protein